MTSKLLNILWWACPHHVENGTVVKRNDNTFCLRYYVYVCVLATKRNINLQKMAIVCAYVETEIGRRRDRSQKMLCYVRIIAAHSRLMVA